MTKRGRRGERINAEWRIRGVAEKTTPPFEGNHYTHQDQRDRKQWQNSPSNVSSLTSEEEQELCTHLHSSYGFDSIEELLKFCFEKKFQLAPGYRAHHRVTKRLYTSEKWTNDQLGKFQTLKKKLNNVKNQLNDYDLNEWHRFTRATNPADIVMRRLKKEMKVEFLTQAWCKFYELVREFNLIPHVAKTSKKLCSIHLCEAPGAFVTSLNHYLKSNHPQIEWRWIANSLNPFYEGNTLSQMINDDRFMMETLDNWHFGPDDTGDITHPDYPEDLSHECGKSMAHLVTADGSFDCQDNPDEQESSVSWLHLKEMLAALRVLETGGCFVIKMFTFFECETICLLYLLYILFGSLQVMKPVTSKEGNSEVYVVCREYIGVDEATPYLEQLYSITVEDHEKFAMFSYDDMDRRFMTKLLECAEFFVGNQIKVIKRNIRLFDHREDEELRRHFEFVQLKLWQKYVDRYGVKSIPSHHNIAQRHYDVRRFLSVMEGREYRRGSHAQQLMRKSLSKEKVCAKISEELNSLEFVDVIKQKRMPHVSIRVDDLDTIPGKPIEKVMSSQFCHGTLIRLRKEMINTITIGEYNELSRDRTNYDRRKCVYRKICDFRGIFRENDNYSEAQRIAFLDIFDALRDLKDSRDCRDLVLVGFPLLTRFNINVLCFLRQIFHEVELKDPCVLYLRKLDRNKLEKWGPKLDVIHRRYTKKSAVMSFFPIDYLTDEPALYSWLVDVNNVRVYNEIRSLIGNLSRRC